MKRDVTLALAYYRNPGMLAIQARALDQLPPELRGSVSLVVVDDGSPAGEAASLPVTLPFSTAVYRMREDIPWNQDACRNLAVARAPAEWVLMTDIDHVPSVSLWRRIITGALADGYAYTFARVNAPKHETYHPHPNSYLMRRKTYDRAGGYDERYRGIYGTDGAFKKRLQAVAKIIPLHEALIRYSREVQPDASTNPEWFGRKSDDNAKRKKAVDLEIANSSDRSPRRGLTEWDRVQ